MDKITGLIQVKIVTILIVGTYCFLVATGKLNADTFESILVMVISFYFGQSSARIIENNKNKKE